MQESFLVHYNRELLHIRRAAAVFAAEHPRIAARLRISEDMVEDPQVGRLIESFAYLTARVREKLDDDFPELLDGLLGILYPHYGRPMPSMAILQIEPSADLAGAYTVPAGSTVDTEPVQGESCRFRTAYPVTLHPLELRSAAIGARPFAAPAIPEAGGAASCLRLSFAATEPGAPFAGAAPRTLRFHLRGQPQFTYLLHELLLNDVVAVAFAEGSGDGAPVVLGASALRPVGFGLDEGVLPYPVEAHAGFRLLSEFFAFPEKFLFVDLAFPEAAELRAKGGALDVFVYLKRNVPQLERVVDAATFALGCTPIVNLFPVRAEPVQADERTSEYRVVPDSRRPQALEVYSIDRVLATNGDGDVRPLSPFYSVAHGAEPRPPGQPDPTAWWLPARRPGSDGSGSETFLSLVGSAHEARGLADTVLSVETTCFNRDLPARLPFGGGQPRLKLAAPSPVVAGLRCLTAPTPTRRAFYGQGGRWRLVSHLALNHLSILDRDAASLRELLRLYDFRDSPDTRALIDGIVELRATSGTARIRGQGQLAFCRGVDIRLVLDDANYSGSSAFMMASVLERFFGLYASVNSFSRLTAEVRGRMGVLSAWPARAGDRILL